MLHSIKGLMIKGMVDIGLSADQAEAVMDRVMAAEDQDVMKERWLHSSDDYTKPLLSVVWMRVTEEAVAWMDESCPEHWARGMFVDTVDTVIAEEKS